MTLCRRHDLAVLMLDLGRLLALLLRRERFAYGRLNNGQGELERIGGVLLRLFCGSLRGLGFGLWHVHMMPEPAPFR